EVLLRELLQRAERLHPRHPGGGLPGGRRGRADRRQHERHGRARARPGDRHPEEPRLPTPPDPARAARRVDAPGGPRRTARRGRGVRALHGARGGGEDGRRRALPRPPRELPHVAPGRGRGARGRARRRVRRRPRAGVERGAAQRRGGAPPPLLSMPIPLSYNVRNLLVRRWTTAFTAGGIALVVAATMLLAALVGGLRQMLVATGEPDNLVVLRKGATSDGSSQVPREAAAALRALRGVAHDARGEPLASRELVNQPFGRRIWTVVGVFDAGGTAFDSEIWADVNDVQDDTRRNGFSGLRLRVEPGADRTALIRRIEGDGRFTLEAKPERTYYEEQAESA